jgi:hypothetical protein
LLQDISQIDPLRRPLVHSHKDLTRNETLFMDAWQTASFPSQCPVASFVACLSPP